MTENNNDIIQPRQFRIYRPNKTGNGVAAAFQLSFKKDEKFNPWMLFLVLAPQVGMDENDNSKFDWKEKSITIKLGEIDLGDLIAVLEGRKSSLGTKGNIYHQTAKGNKVLSLNAKEEGGFSLSVSAQNENKESLGKYYLALSDGDASILLILLKRSVEIIFNW